MGHAQGLDPKRSDFKSLARPDRPQVVRQARGALLQTLAHDRQGQFAAIDGDRKAPEQKRQGADMVVVQMSQHHRGNSAAVKVAHLGNQQVNAQ